MLVKFPVDSSASGPAVELQARPKLFAMYQDYLRSYDNTAEERARQSIRAFLDRNAAATAAWIACTNRRPDEWHPEFEPLYDCLIKQGFKDPYARAEAGKFLGLMVWSEMIAHEELWHFTEYPKADCDFSTRLYFSADAHIRAKRKDADAVKARSDGDEARARRLEADAEALRESKKR